MKATPLTLKKRIALELWRKREQNMLQDHPLQQLFWECTLRCNLRCRHCGSDCKTLSGTQDMPKDDFLRVLDSVARRCDPHQVFVVISGGEPLMRHDLEECCAAIYAKGFPRGMVTNGLLLSAQRLEGLLKAGMHSVTISLDGLEDDHNWMRGHEESFRRVDEAISMLVGLSQISFDIVTCVNRRNYSKLSALREYLIGKECVIGASSPSFPLVVQPMIPNCVCLTTSSGEFSSLSARPVRKDASISAMAARAFLGNYEGEESARPSPFTCQAGVTIGSVLDLTVLFLLAPASATAIIRKYLKTISWM